ncbi:MAG TPA: HD-GYP domain-containing protein [Actinomycetota bacterium]|nr:HD-GYP domain-containing protein [Actinomycetota bacterium]
MSGTSLNIFFTWAATAGLSACLLFLGTGWWMRQPGSTRMSFGELMVWRYVQRRRADERLDEVSRAFSGSDRGEITRYGQLKVLKDLNGALEIRDPYTRGHARRVERHAYRTALAMHLSVDDIFDLRLAASLHDIGKIKVPIEIIRKQGPLDDQEWETMKEHSTLGARLITNIGNQSVVNAVRHHHERWDGSGYPHGISGDAIPLHSRIIAVSDAFDAITSNRPYRGKSNRKEAIDILKTQSGKQFDPEVVDAFLGALPRGLPGIAALSWLGFPALKRVASDFTAVARQAGTVGVAGAIAASGFSGAVASNVNPAKYLNALTGQPRIERAAANNKKPQSQPTSASGLVLGSALKRSGDNGGTTEDNDRSRSADAKNSARGHGTKGRGKALGHTRAKKEKVPPGQAKKDAAPKEPKVKELKSDDGHAKGNSKKTESDGGSSGTATAEAEADAGADAETAEPAAGDKGKTVKEEKPPKATETQTESETDTAAVVDDSEPATDSSNENTGGNGKGKDK